MSPADGITRFRPNEIRFLPEGAAPRGQLAMSGIATPTAAGVSMPQFEAHQGATPADRRAS